MANLPATLAPQNIGELRQLCEMLSRSTMVSPDFRGKPENIALAIMGGAEIGLGPVQALQTYTVINGRLAAWGDGLLAIVRGSPLCLDVIEMIKGEGDLACAVCDARRKGAEPVVRGFSVGDAKKAGLWGKQGPWAQYPLRMLQMRARSFALRDAFPDLLRGITQAEEAADVPREAKDITPAASGALTEALDAFAADEPEKATQQAPESATEPEINRGSDHITDHAGGDRLDEPDEDELLYTARAEALRGEASFREWYLQQLDDEARAQLRGHIKELQAAARAVDKPHSEPIPAPDRPRGAAVPHANAPGGARSPE